MLEINQLTYAAIITISIPAQGRAVTATVTLLPEDQITTATGRVKALRDCTLADLQAFAEALEEEAWAPYESRKLGELAEDDAALVKITLLGENGEQQAVTDESWLSHVVVLAEAAPAGEEPAEPAPPTPVEDAAPTAEPIATETTAAVPTEEALAETPAPESAPVTETAEVTAPAPPPVPEVTAPPKIRIAGLRRPPGHTTPSAVDILINETAFRDAQAHALTSLDREVAGVLVGPRPEKQPDGRYVVHITDIIIAMHTRMHGASVTYTPESWRYIHDKLAERYPDEEAVIVGWYHTHPGFGIFLSGMDLFIHQNFFTQIWHTALVLDPVARKSGFFSWNRQKTQVDRYEFPWPHWAAGSW